MDPAAKSNIFLLPLFRGFAATTNGGALSKSLLDIDNPRVRTMLPHCAAIFVIGLVENVPAADFEFNLAFFSGVDRDHQPPSPIDIAATPFTSAASQGVRCPDYTAVQNFLQDCRIQAWWRNAAGVNGLRTGLITATLGFRLST